MCVGGRRKSPLSWTERAAQHLFGLNDAVARAAGPPLSDGSCLAGKALCFFGEHASEGACVGPVVKLLSMVEPNLRPKGFDCG